MEGGGKATSSPAIRWFITTLSCEVLLDRATRLVFELQQWFATGAEVWG